MKKILAIAALVLCSATASKADCTIYDIKGMTAYLACTNYKGQQYDMTMNTIDALLDYGW